MWTAGVRLGAGRRGKGWLERWRRAHMWLRGGGVAEWVVRWEVGSNVSRGWNRLRA
ncbi:MAG: hypothetical protein ACKERG_03300 [Candidatus Hodgkinia cicadicola]